jgi:hypothetical protein
VAWLLLPQLVALLLGATVVAHRLAPTGFGPASSRRKAATAAAVLLAGAGLVGIGNRLVSQWQDSVDRGSAGREIRGGVETGASVEFVEWLRDRLPAGATYRMVFGSDRGREATYQWMAYRLYPSRITTAEGRADWVVFHRAAPTPAVGGSPLERVRIFRPGFALARVKR